MTYFLTLLPSLFCPDYTLNESLSLIYVFTAMSNYILDNLLYVLNVSFVVYISLINSVLLFCFATFFSFSFFF